MLEELGWLLLFLIFFVYSHYQIKYCIPITLFLLKFIQAACMLMLVKVYVFYRLYGNDMTINNHPYESNLAWTIDMKDEARNFIGKNALLKVDREISQKIIGVLLKDRGVLRPGYEITHEQGKGIILSGTYSPTLEASIGLARVDQGHGDKGQVMIRNKALNIDFVSPRFLRQGKM